MLSKHAVAIAPCEEYDVAQIASILRTHFAEFGLTEEFFRGKKVAVKPNLVIRKAPEAAATTHPAVLDALLTVLREMNITPTIAESPGGVYDHLRLKNIYRTCGIAEVAERHGAILNYDTDAVYVNYPAGKTVKRFHVIKPIAEADVIFDLCKLKSHSLTKMSAAVKNFFGVIPGIEKFEMHATFPDYKDFGSMICDLCSMLCQTKEIVAITDAIIGMEGDGPTAGDPRKIGAILTSRDPFASDLASETILGFAGTVPLVREAISRGLCPETASALEIFGAHPEVIALSDFKEPETAKSKSTSVLSFFSQGKLGRFFMPKPMPDLEKCRGCGECVASCPQKTITLVEKNGKMKAAIHHADCIRCYCCQELCPFEAIYVKKNLIIRIVGAI